MQSMIFKGTNMEYSTKQNSPDNF